MPCEILTSDRVSGRCPQCGDDMSPAHFDGKHLTCARCCMEHGEKAFKEWRGPVKTLSGKQEGLFK